MTTQKIIDELAALKAPNRLLDQAIAKLFNFRREKITVSATEGKPDEIRVVWYDPAGKKVGNVPKFTASIDDAKSLLDHVLPDSAGGFSFHRSYALARIGDAEAVKAFNEATALCLATIKAAPHIESGQ